jgi:hypothetical protein
LTWRRSYFSRHQIHPADFPFPGEFEPFQRHQFGSFLASGFVAALDGPADQGFEEHAAQARQRVAI